MPDNDIFDDKNKPDETIITDDDPIKNDELTPDQLLAQIVNEDGTPKYKTANEALIAAKHAQDHIKTLETDNKVLKEKGNASDKLDELLEAVKQKSDGSGQDDSVSTMKPEDVLGIVKEYFNDTKVAETRESNINSVAKVFKDRYGKDASDKLYGGAEDLGFSRKEINSLIAVNPNAVLKVLGMDKKVEQETDILAMKSSAAAAQFQGHPDKKPESIMGATSTKQLTDAFAASKQRTLKRLGIEEK